MGFQPLKLLSRGFWTAKLAVFRPLERYEPILHDREEADAKDNAKPERTEFEHSRSHLTRAKGYQSRIIAFGGWILAIILTAALTVLVWHEQRTLGQRCFAVTSAYSPLLHQVPNGLTETVRNGSIRWPSPYRGEPSQAVDRAWDRISVFRPLDLALTDEQFRMIGQDPETAAKNSPEYGGGYFLQVEFSHQLHCVNLLRKASYFKYEYYLEHDPDFKDKEETFKVHFDHCVEMLRQLVMCHADVGLVTAHWIDQRARPWPDFNTKQTCRNFEGILQWTIEHQLPEDAPMMPLKPPGAKALSSPP